MISFRHSGNFDNTEKMLKSMKKRDVRVILDKYGRRGVDALSQNTPVESGKTAASWCYEIHTSRKRYEIVWTNSNLNDGVSVAILLQYGHATRNGGYVYGVDYINPALSKIFEQMADEVWKEVTAG